MLLRKNVVVISFYPLFVLTPSVCQFAKKNEPSMLKVVIEQIHSLTFSCLFKQSTLAVFVYRFFDYYLFDLAPRIFKIFS